MGGNCQLKVVKRDGSVEGYLHTKVMGSVSSALAETEQGGIHVAEELAEVVTYFLYRNHKSNFVSSSEIFSIVKAVLGGTGYEDAAIVLSEHHFQRRLKRSRIEVVSADIREIADAESVNNPLELDQRSSWEKSRIASYLVSKHNVSWQTARVISSIVEQKVFNIGVVLVPSSLIKQLVLTEAAMVLRAERQLQSV